MKLPNTNSHFILGFRNGTLSPGWSRPGTKGETEWRIIRTEVSGSRLVTLEERYDKYTI